MILARTHFSLCSGIGGIDLACEWANFVNLGFCEQDLFCQAVLRKNFGQGIPIFGDVRTLTAESLWERGIDWPFLVSAGFPCQDVSIAGVQAGLGTEDAPTGRSGLWFACLRFIRDVRPRYVLIENVRNLVHQGIDVVLGGLGEAGYTCWAGIMGAEAVGAPHRRERVFIAGFNSSCDGSEWNRGSGRRPDADAQSLGEREPLDQENSGSGSRAAGQVPCSGGDSLKRAVNQSSAVADSDECGRRTDESHLSERQCDDLRGSPAVAGVAEMGDACDCRCTGGARVLVAIAEHDDAFRTGGLEG